MFLPSFSRLLLKLPPRLLGIVVWLLIFGGSCMVLTYLYAHSARAHKAMLEQMIGTLSQSAAIMVDMELHQQLQDSSQQTSDTYRRALAPLVAFHRKLPDAQYIYTMRVTDADELFFVLDTATDSDINAMQETLGRKMRPSMLMESYTLPYSSEANAELLRTLRTGSTFVDHTPFVDEYGQFVTAHAPLFTLDGDFEGFIGVDYNIEAYRRDLATLRGYGLFSLLLALVVSALLARLTLRLRQQALNHLQQIADERDRAERANEAKSELLSIATHDLKNPLSAISSMAELLIHLKKSGQLLPEQEVACLQNIRESSRHMFALVRRILESERLESNSLRLEWRPVELVALCQSVIDANQQAANRKHLNVVVELPESLTILADAELLSEAFDNYINNAVKYSPHERTIRITLQKRSDIGMAEFAVQDEGPGLTPNDMQHVFGKFRRLSARPTGGEHSTGLGLSIVKQVVELHGGTVGCDSTAGNGARFWARLPLQSAT